MAPDEGWEVRWGKRESFLLILVLHQQRSAECQHCGVMQHDCNGMAGMIWSVGVESQIR